MADIKQSYRRLVRSYHPDLVEGLEEDFYHLTVAYNVLVDPTQRTEYNLTGAFDDKTFGEIQAEINMTLVKVFEGMMGQLPPEQHMFMIKHMKYHFDQTIPDIERKLKNIKVVIKHLDGLKVNFTKAGSGDNLFTNVLDKKIKDHKEEFEAVGKDLRLQKRVRDDLENYDDVEDMIRSRITVTNNSWTATTSASGF